MTLPESAPPEFTVVMRDIDLGLPADELWSLISDGAEWAEWMVDEAAVSVAPGSSGTVADGGELRRVEITSVLPGESVRFVWWPSDRVDLASSVSLTIERGEDGAPVLRVVEVFPPELPVDPVEASLAWEVRAVSAWARCVALARV